MKLPRLVITLIAAAAIFINQLTAGKAFDFRDHLGLQLYSLRHQFNEDREATVERVAGYGITEVESAGYYGWTPEEFVTRLGQSGLQVYSAHIGYEALEKDPQAVLDEMVALGVDTAFCPYARHEGKLDAEECARIIADFNKWGEMFHEKGIRFGYHPHGFEFVPGEEEGETLFDQLIQGCDPRYVFFEMDVFWVVHAGVDPVALLNKYPDRWIALHIKDIRIGAPTGFDTGSAPATDKVVVGDGQVDWKAVIGTSVKLGVRYYFIEDESTDPVGNIPKSVEYLKNLELD